MKRMLFLWLAGCGTSDPATWEKCAVTRCSTDAAATWDVIADGAEVVGQYDPIGPPDPYLCLTLDQSTHCSSSISDNSSPRWDETIIHSATVADLTQGALTAALWDEDTGGLDTNDFICSAEITITTDDLDQGGIQLSCSNGTKAAFRFHYVK